MKESLRRWLAHDPLRAQSYAQYRQRYGRSRALYHALKSKSLCPDAKRTIVCGSESARDRRRSPLWVAQQLARYDIVSFDVFDTLLLRCVDDPTTLFHIVGAQLNVLDFPTLRIEAERAARQDEVHGEVTLAQIYARLADQGIDAAAGMRLEWEMERACCYASPYWLRVVQALAAQGKTLIAVSDMYLSKAQIITLLEESGYPPFSQVFVSCEYGANKASGELFAIVLRQCGEAKTYVHVGDHPHSDHTVPRRYGFLVLRAPNVHAMGERYRAHDMSKVTGSVYRALVNAKLHGGEQRLSKAFELGYVYGAILAIGYCQFLHEQRRQQQLDQLLFLARDGDILQQVYALLYPQEQGDLHYVPWSRTAGSKLLANVWRSDYYRRFLLHKCGQGLTVAQVLKAMDLEALLPSLCAACSLEETSELTLHSERVIRAFLDRHFAQVRDIYAPQIAGAKQRLEPWLSTPGKVGVVDIGWTGSAAIALRALVREWGWQKEIIGFLVGSDTPHDHIQGGRSAGAHALGILHTYAFSPAHNRALWKRHDPTALHNVLAELLFASPTPSLKRFWQQPDGTGVLCQKPMEEAGAQYAQIQQGIRCFVHDYLQRVPAVLRQQNIQCDDAYAPFVLLTNGCNRAYLDEILSWMRDNHV